MKRFTHIGQTNALELVMARHRSWRLFIALILLVASPTVSAAEPAGIGDPSGPELMQAHLDSLEWMANVDSFYIRSRQTVRKTKEGWAWDRKQPPLGFLSTSSRDEPFEPRPYVIDETHAWDRTRICAWSHSYQEGEEATKSHHHVRQWDGKLAIEWSFENAEPAKWISMDDGLDQMFGVEEYLNMWTLPWGCGNTASLWWLKEKSAEFRESRGMVPELFELVAREDVDGQDCYVVESKVSHYRMHLGAEDGRLYQREWLLPSPKQRPFNALDIYRQVCGPEIKSEQHLYSVWLPKQSKEERIRIYREIEKAKHEFSVPLRRHKLGDYREVAPGCWLPFHQISESFNLESPQSFLERTHEYVVQEAAVNQPLDEALFQYELYDGMQVSTDWRFDPPISYKYRSDMPREELLALAAERQRKIDEGQAMMTQAQEKLMSRRGQTPPPLPQTDWIFGEPLNWQQLRGKVVLLSFLSIHCGPCKNEYPMLTQWHQLGGDDVVVIGVHPPTDNIEAVKRDLTADKAEFPTIIDPVTEESGEQGMLHHWFGANWWPNSVLIDKRGAVAGFGAFSTFGAGENLSRQIQRLLAEED